MSDLEKIFEQLKGIHGEIDKIIKKSTYSDYDDMSGLNIDYTDSEQLFLLDELRGIFENLDKVNYKITYLKTPIVYSGTLSKNNQGRYELPNGHYFTSGDRIECLINDDFHEYFNEETDKYESIPYWIKTSVEHNGKDYYLVYNKDIPLQGLLVRIRDNR